MRDMKNRSKRFVKIQDGCDKFCYYCVSIHRRGRSRSRSIESIVKVIKQAEKEGKKEAILAGVDVADFKPGLDELLEKVLGETKKIKIGFGSINLVGLTDELIKLWSENQERMVNYLHISLQSGCNETLKRMNRKHTIEEYVRVVKKLRKALHSQGKICKGLSTNDIHHSTIGKSNETLRVGTDIIVGYPGESEEEFEESFKNIKKLQFDNLHVFRYSKRERTVAAKRGEEWGLVDEKEKKRRAELMRALYSQGKIG